MTISPELVKMVQRKKCAVWLPQGRFPIPPGLGVRLGQALAHLCRFDRAHILGNLKGCRKLAGS